MPVSASPSASPPLPVPAARSTVTPCAGQAVGGDIDAGTAVENVGSLPALHNVVTVPARQEGRPVVATERIGIGRSDHGVDADQNVALGAPALIEAGAEVDRNRRRGLCVGGGVHAPVAEQGVGPLAAIENIVALAAEQEVGAVVPGQAVGVGGTLQVLDRDEPIALGRRPGGRAGTEIDRHRGRGMGIGRGVVAAAAVEHVDAQSALENVGAARAEQSIGGGGTGQHVIVRRTGQDLDAGIGITGGVAIGAAIGKAGDYPAGGSGIGRRVDARATLQGVGSLATLQDVVAATTPQQVVAAAAQDGAGPVIPDQRVAGRGPDQVADVHQHVPGRIAARAGAGRQIDGHPCAGPCIGRGIGARSADQQVGTTPAFQGVIAAAAEQSVVEQIAGETVVMIGADHDLDVDHAVALGIPPGTVAAGQADRDARSGLGIAHRVEAVAAIHFWIWSNWSPSASAPPPTPMARLTVTPSAEVA